MSITTTKKKKKLLLIGGGTLAGYVILKAKGLVAPVIEDATDRFPTGNGHYSARAREDITTLIVHHSASPSSTVDSIARDHIHGRRWPGIGYHYILPKGGGIIQTNRIETRSYHVKGMNAKSVGICLLGNFENEEPTYAQLVALRSLIRTLRNTLPRRVTVAGHRDYDATLCPGKNLYPKIKGL